MLLQCGLYSRHFHKVLLEHLDLFVTCSPPLLHDVVAHCICCIVKEEKHHTKVSQHFLQLYGFQTEVIQFFSKEQNDQLKKGRNGCFNSAYLILTLVTFSIQDSSEVRGTLKRLLYLLPPTRMSSSLLECKHLLSCRDVIDFLKICVHDVGVNEKSKTHLYTLLNR